jgi:hypothetical protein
VVAVLRLSVCLVIHKKIFRGFSTFIGIKLKIKRMISTTDIRNKVIDQVMAIKDGEFLRALSDIIDRSHVQEDAISLTEEQKVMLAMSEEDIKAGRTIDQHTLNERELEWLQRK